MKSEILKIAKVKNEAEFYRKYPNEEAFMKAHGKEFKKAAMGKSMVNQQLDQLTDFGNPPIAQLGGSFGSIGVPGLSTAKFDKSTGLVNNVSGSVSKADTTSLGFEKNAPGSAGSGTAGAFAAAGLQSVGQIIGGIEAIAAQKKAQKKAQQSSELGALALTAQQGTKDPARKYVRPEDSLVQPGQLGSPQGTGTNYLAQYGANIGGNQTEVQNMYNPGDLYSDLGYKPIEEKYKQYRHGGNLPQAEFGEYFQDSGQAQIGGAIGEAAGTALFGPLGGMAGKLLGQVGGNLLGGAKDARELQAQKDKTAMNQSMMGFQQARSQGPLNASLKDGGYMNPEYNPQVITKFGDYSIDQLLQPPHDADMLRAGGHLKEYTPPSAEAMYTGRQDMPQAQFGLAMGMMNKGMIDTVQNSEKANKLKQAVSAGMMNYGGQMAMGGDLQVAGGEAETISYNPFLPDGGETVMFNGPSHDNGGIDVQYGQNGVEVEGGEPAVKLEDGGSDGSLVVFGNMKLSKMSADAFGISEAMGKKFKHVANEISKVEKKQNKLINTATENADMTDGNSGFDQLKMNTSQAQLMGANMKLKSAAMLKQNLASVQNAILDTASELGVKSDELAQGKLVKETDPRMIAQDGKKMGKYEKYMNDLEDYNLEDALPASKNINALSDTAPSIEDMPGDSTSKKSGKLMNALKSTGKFLGKGFEKYGPTALSNISPYLRPSNANSDLPPDQLYPEYYALANNQLDPVQAQTFQPMLDTPYDISLNDQLSAIDSQSRSIMRQVGNNPGVLANIAGQTLEAKNKVLGEQTRINQANKMQVYDKNRAMLNQSQLQNLQIFDKQYERQAQAKSNTKEQTQVALNSIASKIAQQRASNRKLAIMENMYNFRFSPSGRAINMNDPAQFNLSGGMSGTSQRGLDPSLEYTYDGKQQIIGTRKIPRSNQPSTNELDGLGKYGKNIKARNGSIVQALKNL